MSLSRRKDGRWCVKYRDASGKWRQRSFKDENEARRFDDEQKYDAQADTPMTLRECVTAYVLAHPKLVETSRARYSFIVNGCTHKDGTHTEGPAEFLATKFCKDLDRRDLENLRAGIIQRGNKPATANIYVTFLRAALNWAASEELIEENPWRKYRNLPEGRKVHRNGTLEDFQKIYDALPPWAQWACRTCLALCLRPGHSELCSLTWDAFDWQGKSVKVFMPKVGADKVVYPPESYLAEAWERYQAPRRHEFVCMSRLGGRMNYGAFWWVWERARQAVGVKKMPPYAMRHIAASMMLAGGADMAAVAAQLGHANIATTAAFYTHAVASAQRRAAAVNPLVHLVQIGAESEGESGH